MAGIYPPSHLLRFSALLLGWNRLNSNFVRLKLLYYRLTEYVIVIFAAGPH